MRPTPMADDQSIVLGLGQFHAVDVAIRRLVKHQCRRTGLIHKRIGSGGQYLAVWLAFDDQVKLAVVPRHVQLGTRLQSELAAEFVEFGRGHGVGPLIADAIVLGHGDGLGTEASANQGERDEAAVCECSV